MALKLNKFTREELVAVIGIFFVLIVVSVPNFSASLRRARNQTRKDDLAFIRRTAESYRSDFGSYPLSTADGKFLACLTPGGKVEIASDGRLIADLIPCEWDKDPIMDLTPGSSKVYAKKLPKDPHSDRGVRYIYLSDGSRFQVFSALEGRDDAEYDAKIVARGLSCGEETCSIGRGYGCAPEKTLAQCEKEMIESSQIKNEKK